MREGREGDREREGEGGIGCPILKRYVKLCRTKLCFSYMKYDIVKRKNSHGSGMFIYLETST